MEMPLDIHAFVPLMFPHCNASDLYIINVLFWPNILQGHWGDGSLSMTFCLPYHFCFVLLEVFKKASYL